MLRSLASRSRNLADIDAAITMNREAADAIPRAHPERFTILHSLFSALFGRHELTGDIADIDQTIAIGRQMLAEAPEGDYRRANILPLLASALRDRAEATDRVEDHDESISAYRLAVASVPDRHPGQLENLANLGRALRARFELTGRGSDLDDALTILRQAADEEAASAANGGIPDDGAASASLASALLAKHNLTGDLDPLLTAIAEARRAIVAPLTSADDVIGNQSLLSRALRIKFELTGEEADLAEAVALARQSVKATPVGHPDLGSYRLTLGQALRAQAKLDPVAQAPAERAERSELIATMAALVNLKAVSDLPVVLAQSAIDDAHRLGELLEQDELPDLDALGLLGRYYWLSYLALGEDADDTVTGEVLDLAITAYAPVFAAGREIPTDLRPDVAAAAAAEAADRFDEVLLSGDVELLTESVVLWRRIYDVTPADDTDRAAYQGMLGLALCARFAQTGDLADLDNGMATLRDSITILPSDSELLPIMRAALSEASQSKFAIMGDPDDLDQSVAEAELAVRETAESQESGYARGQLGLSLLTRYQVQGAPDDLDTAIELLTATVRATPSDDPTRWAHLMRLADAMRMRFERSSDLPALDLAVGYGREALAAAPAGHPGVAGACAVLGSVLVARSAHNGEGADLDTAISVLTQGTEATKPSHPLHALCLGPLGSALVVRFTRTGDQADLGRAIQTLTRGLAALPAGNVARTRLSSALGMALLCRFEISGSATDLESALALCREATAISADHPDLPAYLYTLATGLQLQFMRTDDLAVLDESIDVTRRALAVCSPGQVQRALCLFRLGSALRVRCLLTEDLATIDEAVSLGREAVKAAGGHSGLAPLYLAELGVTQWVKYLGADDQADLDEAIATLRQAITLSEGLPAQAENRMRLAYVLDSASQDQDQPDAEHLREAIDLYTEVANAVTASPMYRITAARLGAGLALAQTPGLASDLLESAVRLLPQSASLQLSRTDRQYALSQVTLLASEAAEAALVAASPNAAARALGLLELGRAVLQGQALDARTDLLKLHASYPALASMFLKLRDRLDAPDGPVATSPATLTVNPPDQVTARVQASDRFQAAAALAELLDDIRQLDGFESFLLPPPPGDLIKHAAEGPIVAFNVGRDRSDALAVTTEGITGLRLPELAAHELAERIDTWDEAIAIATDPDVSSADRTGANDVLSDILEWLWDVAAEPVLSHLGINGPPGADEQWPRIWWAPGGFLGLLPLHAAGYHRLAGRAETVLDRAVASYTPTIRALAYARERARSTLPRRSLIVAMPVTPGAGPGADLRFARAEADLLAELLPSPVLLIEEVRQLAHTAPTADAVVRELASAGIADFACHAFSHQGDPSQSRIILHDHRKNPFSVASLCAYPASSRPARLPLSACQTARNDSFDLIDEGIHLTSAFQLAGFPHVIGTLWPIFDDKAMQIARAFYLRLGPEPRKLDPSLSGEALHGAIREIRDLTGAAARPAEWASHVHAGA